MPTMPSYAPPMAQPGYAQQPGSLQQQWAPPFTGSWPQQGKGKGKGGEGKGKGKGKGGRSTPLDSPMRSNCPYLRGPFAPQNERFDNPVTCSHCASVGTTANHSGSWECDLHWWTPRSKFNRREIDRWGNPLAGGAAMPGLQQLMPPPPPPQQ